MFFQLRHVCPACGNLADFLVHQVTEFLKRDDRPGEFKLVEHKPGRQAPPLSDAREGCGLARCPLCTQPLMIVFRAPAALLTEALDSGQRRGGIDMKSRLRVGETVTIVGTFPQTEDPKPHRTWPEKIQVPFVDLQHMLRERRHPPFVISGCRTVLDVATRHLGARRDRLVDRIDELADRNVVTGILRDWSHKLRLDGNAAVHELEGTEEDARQLVEFMKLFLHVAFELPARSPSKLTRRSNSRPKIRFEVVKPGRRFIRGRPGPWSPAPAGSANKHNHTREPRPEQPHRGEPRASWFPAAASKTGWGAPAGAL
jgi:hypothetical protein